jgi:hypothetical protein
LIWTVSLFLPAVTYDRNDWFFPGRNLGVLAAWMSFLALVLFLTALTQISRDPAMLLLRLHRLALGGKHLNDHGALQGSGDSARAGPRFLHNGVDMVLSGAVAFRRCFAC